MKLTVVSSNPSNEGKTFVTKLKGSKTVDLGILGTKTVDRHYYISAPKQTEVDATLELNLGLFNIVKHPFELVDEDTGDITEMQLSWLHLK